jgi:hypothetical protein
MNDLAGNPVRPRRHVMVIGVALPLVLGSGATLAPAAAGQELAPEIVVYVTDLSRRNLSEFRFWEDPASPGGRLVGYPNTADELDPPPENDPHVTFTVPVRAGVAYRCWVHMKVGPPRGVAKANMVWVQFTGAVDASGAETLAPRTRSYLTARGPTDPGWTWVSCDPDRPGADPLVRFQSSGEVTVRIQAGMEGVGFDQFVLSPSRYLARAPSEAVVPKPD